MSFYFLVKIFQIKLLRWADFWALLVLLTLPHLNRTGCSIVGSASWDNFGGVQAVLWRVAADDCFAFKNDVIFRGIDTLCICMIKRMWPTEYILPALFGASVRHEAVVWLMCGCIPQLDFPFVDYSTLWCVTWIQKTTIMFGNVLTNCSLLSDNTLVRVSQEITKWSISTVMKWTTLCFLPWLHWALGSTVRYSHNLVVAVVFC